MRLPAPHTVCERNRLLTCAFRGHRSRGLRKCRVAACRSVANRILHLGIAASYAGPVSQRHHWATKRKRQISIALRVRRSVAVAPRRPTRKCRRREGEGKSSRRGTLRSRVWAPDETVDCGNMYGGDRMSATRVWCHCPARYILPCMHGVCTSIISDVA
jgi:hypothetical protein